MKNIKTSLYHEAFITHVYRSLFLRRSVSEHDKSMAVGLSAFLMTLVGKYVGNNGNLGLVF